jgi:hypothetical protein
MSRLIVILCFLFLAPAAFGQPAKIQAWGEGWVDVTSYSGKTESNFMVMMLQAQNSQQFNMDKWSMNFWVTGPITNGQTTFPADKLKFRFNNLKSNGAANGIQPTAQNINLNTSPIPFALANTYFVQQSPYSLSVDSYFSVNFSYDVLVDPGAYMIPLSSWQNFRVNLIVELRNSSNVVVSSGPYSFDMRIRPTDTPPQTPTYGIQFDASAKNVLLEFKTAGDYANGVSKTLIKAFSTFSNTPYVVRVNTLNSNLTSSGNHTLPVNAVKLSVKDNQSGAVTGNVNLSGSQQNILTSSAHTATKFFDTTYSTQAGDNTFFNKSYEQYSGTVVFTMIPQ